jgi:hypothetical protein
MRTVRLASRQRCIASSAAHTSGPALRPESGAERGGGEGRGVEWSVGRSGAEWERCRNLVLFRTDATSSRGPGSLDVDALDACLSLSVALRCRAQRAASSPRSVPMDRPALRPTPPPTACRPAIPAPAPMDAPSMPMPGDGRWRGFGACVWVGCVDLAADACQDGRVRWFGCRFCMCVMDVRDGKATVYQVRSSATSPDRPIRRTASRLRWQGKRSSTPPYRVRLEGRPVFV